MNRTLDRLLVAVIAVLAIVFFAVTLVLMWPLVVVIALTAMVVQLISRMRNRFSAG